MRANVPSGEESIRAGVANASSRKPANPFRCFDSSPEAIRLAVMMYVRFPLPPRNVEDLLFERGIDICHETVRHWWNRFGSMFTADICRQRVNSMLAFGTGGGTSMRCT